MTVPPAHRPPDSNVVLLVDLDDTLYQSEELRHLCASNIRRYMVERLSGFTEETVHEACAELYLHYGTTLAGLVATGHTLDYEDWHREVHGTLPYQELLSKDDELRAMLNSIEAPKWVFTNADQRHADVCLDLLGVADCFQGVIAFEDLQRVAQEEGLAHHNKPVLCKPQRQAFEMAMRLAGVGVGDGRRVVFLDDSTRNIASAHKMGLFSILVGRTGVECNSHLQLQTIHDLPAACSWLWPGKPQPAAS